MEITAQSSVSRLTPRYTARDQLFLRWMEQADWPSANYKRVLRLLFDHQRRHGRVFLYHATIAEWLHISNATVKRALRFLAGLGLVIIKPQRTKFGSPRENYYKVIPRILAVPGDPNPVQADPTPDHGDPTPPVIHKAQTKTAQGIAATRGATDHKELFMGKKDNKDHMDRSGTRSRARNDSQSRVVVFPATPFQTREDLPPVLQHLAQHLGLPNPFVLSLCTKDNLVQVERVLTWVAQCPPGHKAAPRNVEGWITDAIRTPYQTPPTWVKKAAPANPQPATRFVWGRCTQCERDWAQSVCAEDSTEAWPCPDERCSGYVALRSRQ